MSRRPEITSIKGVPYIVPLILILLGAFTKSAQFPFHFWLPNAMAAPTPVSAYLHSATMVKAGVFLLARLYPALGSSDLVFDAELTATVKPPTDRYALKHAPGHALAVIRPQLNSTGQRTAPTSSPQSPAQTPTS